VTTAGENGKEFFAVCLRCEIRQHSPRSEIVHRNHAGEIPTIQQLRPPPTPVLEEGRCYAHFGTHGTACIDTATGKVLWENNELHCDHYRGPASSPIIYGNLLMLTFDGFDAQFVAALDKTNGKIVWKKDRKIDFPKSSGDLKKAFATPAILEVNGKPQLVSPAAEATIAYDPMTGDELWRVIHGGMNEAARPVFGHGMIYLTTGHPPTLLAVAPGRLRPALERRHRLAIESRRALASVTAFDRRLSLHGERRWHGLVH